MPTLIFRSAFRHIHSVLGLMLVILNISCSSSQIDSSLIKQAEAGDGSAQLRLGHKYRFGEDTSPDREKALKWYRLAAKQYLTDAIFALTEMGHPPEDYRKTLQSPWTAFKRGYSEILDGNYPDYLFSDPFVTISSEDTGEILKIPSKKMADLMTLIVPKATFEKYGEFFNQLMEGNPEKDFQDEQIFPTPYCFRGQCGFLGLRTWEGGRIVSFTTDDAHFQEISTRYRDLLQRSKFSRCQFGTPISRHIYEVIEVKQDSVLLLRDGETQQVEVENIRAALIESERELENVFFLEVAGNQFLSFETGKNFSLEGSGRYANEESSLVSINGQIKRMYFFPSIVADKYVARWIPDGAKFGDSLMIVNLETRDIHLLGDTTWGSKIDDVFDTKVYPDDATTVASSRLVRANLGSNNFQLELYPNHDDTGWIIETDGEHQQELFVYLPEAKSLANCER